MSNQNTSHSSGGSPAPQPHHGVPSTTIRRKSAVFLAVGALVLGGALGASIAAGVGSAATAQAEAKASNEAGDFRARIQALKEEAEGDASTIKSLEADVEELENAPALLAEQRKSEEAAAKKESEEKKAAEEAAAKKKADEEAAAKAEQEKAARTFPGDGTFVVGDDIKAGTYKSDAAYSSFIANCYWARLSGTSGDFEQIITNNNSQGPTTVTIRPTDAAFETNGCTTWERVD